MLRLELDVTITEGYVSGAIRVPDGPAQPFSGWLGLIEMLERLATEPTLGDRSP